MQLMVGFLYPSGDMELNVPYSSAEDPPLDKGGHATNPDSNIRSRLRDITERLDKQYFNSTIALLQQTFRCGFWWQRY